jgi:hypothetical protein
MPRLIARRSFDAARLAVDHPTRITDKKKKVIFDLISPADATHRGAIELSRWALDAAVTTCAWPPATARTRVEVRDGVMTYGTATLEGALVWHLNFANQDLFCAYGGPAFAQDEIQVAEHPLLGSVREALIADGGIDLAPTTRVGETPTPVLIRGVERRAAIATEPDLESNRALGLYGNQLRRAADDVIRSAITLSEVPTLSNIVAIEAPYASAAGPYSRADLLLALTIAWVGFDAVVSESRVAGATGVELHTGHWGTGVYGGDRVGMALIQLIAANLSGVDRVVFHAFDDDGVEQVKRAERHLDRLRIESASDNLDSLVDHLTALGFRWGAGDGNLRADQAASISPSRCCSSANSA